MPDPIIHADKRPWAEWLVVRLLVTPALRSHFHAVWLRADPAAWALRRVPPVQRPPLIYVCTHTSWWDGYLLWPLNRAFGARDGYLMMDVLSLRNFRFFRWAGAYSVDRANPRSALQSIEYSAELLRAAPNRALAIFPQGTITPPDRRPLGLYAGVAHIARRLPVCDIQPIAWRLVYRYEQRAEIFIRAGAPLHLEGAGAPGGRAITAWVDAALTAEDDLLQAELTDGDISRPLPGYRPLLHGRASINRVWERVQAGAARLVGGPPVPPAP